MKKYANELKIKKVWKQVKDGSVMNKVSSKAFAIPILTASSKCLRANFCSIITLYS